MKMRAAGKSSISIAAKLKRTPRAIDGRLSILRKQIAEGQDPLSAAGPHGQQAKIARPFLVPVLLSEPTASLSRINPPPLLANLGMSGKPSAARTYLCGLSTSAWDICFAQFSIQQKARRIPEGTTGSLRHDMPRFLTLRRLPFVGLA